MLNELQLLVMKMAKHINFLALHWTWYQKRIMKTQK